MRISGALARLAVLLLALGAGGCGADVEQARLCAAAVGAFAERPETVEILARERISDHRVALRWRAGAAGPARRIECSFAGGAFEAGRLDLASVAVDGRALSGMQLFWLERWLGIRTALLPEPAAGDSGDSARMGGGAPSGLYALQQFVNAVVPACIYGLLAVGFTLAYAVIGQINLAFGDIAMVGAVATVVASLLLGAAGAAGMPAALLLLLALSVLTAAAASWAGERLVFRPLRDGAAHMVLIAGVGLAILLREGVRLLQGSGDLWVQPPFPGRFVLAAGGGFEVVASLSQFLILGLTMAAFAGLLALMGHTHYGLAHRACAEDRRAAALMGVDVDRTVGRSFMLGGALAGLAAFVAVQHYGVANAYIGVMLGFKALTAAIVGGLGSVGGAMLGGAVVAAVEIAWAGWLDGSYKDIAVFGLLAGMLALRPAGLLGRPPP